MILATNANRTIPDYLDSGTWEPRASIATLASAMDVGDPSNMERLRSLWGDADQLRNHVRSFSVTDAEIRSQIQAEFGNQAIAWCPHTATGFHVYRNLLSAEERAKGHWVIAATAHAAKFNEIVEPLIGESVPVPDELEQLLHWPAKFDIIEADAEQIIGRLK
jgi:threonine synthase